MSKKHFIALADLIRSCRSQWKFSQIERLADWCYEQNPRFNRKRWYDYIDGLCGPNGGKVKT